METPEALDPKYLEIGKWPISRHYEGKWHFVEIFEGTLREAYKKAHQLETDNANGVYRIWDDR